MSHGAPGTSPRAVGGRRPLSAERTPSSFETPRRKRVYTHRRPAKAWLLRMRAVWKSRFDGAIPHGEEPAVAQVKAGVSNHEGARAQCLTTSSRTCRASA